MKYNASTSVVLLLKPIYSQIFDWVDFLRPSALRFTNYSYVQIQTNKNRFKSQVSHLKVQRPIRLKRSKNEAKLTPHPNDVPEVHYYNKHILSKLLLVV